MDRDQTILRMASEENLSNREIGRRLKIDESTVRRVLNGLNFHRHLLPTNIHPERFSFHLDQPLQLTGDAVITADWHIPLYDPSLVNELVQRARREKIKTLVIAGDFWNFDALSQYDPKQEEANLERELNEGLAMMRLLLESFDSIYYIWGNHDARLHKTLGYKIEFKTAMRKTFGELGEEALKRITFSNLDHLYVDDWYICHPATYSRVPLTTARRLSAKYNANVITAHSHHCAVGYAENGVNVVAEIGGLFDRDKTAYLQRSTTFPRWQPGYAFLQGGKLRVYSPGWSLG